MNYQAQKHAKRDDPVFATAPTDFPQAIRTTTLPDRVAELISAYDDVVGIRDEFVWKWIYNLLPEFTLSCVEPPAESTVREQKTLLTLFITTLDDIAEQRQDKATFERLRMIPFTEQHRVVTQGGSDVDDELVMFAHRVWQTFEAELESAPRYAEFIDILRYDVRQSINAMDYSQLVSTRPTMANLKGAYRYDAHNMVMFPYADVDLMYSPEFEMADLSVLRQTIWHLQRMARIGNWVTTWERELREGDYSSGVIVAALEKGLIAPDELTADDEATIEDCLDRIVDRQLDQQLLDEWTDLHTYIRERPLSADSVDLDGFIDGMQTVLDYHLASEGHK
ncbi:MAG: hypothetical protein SVG88_09110 [Halobacteriales archaeon]|nr:hypothetical protein [Halobacteriales archaeon]